MEPIILDAREPTPVYNARMSREDQPQKKPTGAPQIEVTPEM